MIRAEQAKAATPAEVVSLIWRNMQDARYGASWAKLWLVFWGMPAERRNVELTFNAQFTMNDVAAARHAQQIAEKRAGIGALVEGECRELRDTIVMADMEKAAAESVE